MTPGEALRAIEALEPSEWALTVPWSDLPVPLRAHYERRAEEIMAQADAIREKMTPAPVNDGWIAWGGGDCPVHVRSVVDVRFRGVSEMHHQMAYYFSWKHYGDIGDIIAYRVVKDGTP